MDKQEEIAILKERYLTTSSEDDAMAIADKMIDLGGNTIYTLFTPLLELDSSQQIIRSRAAYILKKTGRNGSLDPLLKAIFKKENINSNAVFVDALYTHDCTFSLDALFEILFYHGYDAKIAAHRNLMDHEYFSFSKPEILDLKEMWEDLQRNPEKSLDYDISKSTIEEAVNKFLSYLEMDDRPSAGFTSIEEEVEFLKNVVITENENVGDAVERLAWIGDDVALEFFLYLITLDNTRSDKRHLGTIGLRCLRDNRAVDPLFAAALKKENINYNGSLVYALTELDCSHKLRELFEILFYHGYEAQVHAYNILCDQTFEFSRQDIIDVKKEWQDLPLHPEKYPRYNDSKNMIDDAVSWYLTDLEENEQPV